MKPVNQRRGWVLIAAIAIGFALLIMMVPHGHSGDSADSVAILPLLLAGFISPLSLLGPLAYVYAGRIPEAPSLAASYQRPPPLPRG